MAYGLNLHMLHLDSTGSCWFANICPAFTDTGNIAITLVIGLLEWRDIDLLRPYEDSGMISWHLCPRDGPRYEMSLRNIDGLVWDIKEVMDQWHLDGVRRIRMIT